MSSICGIPLYAHHEDHKIKQASYIRWLGELGLSEQPFLKAQDRDWLRKTANISF